jgi:hypothetical protein
MLAHKPRKPAEAYWDGEWTVDVASPRPQELHSDALDTLHPSPPPLAWFLPGIDTCFSKGEDAGSRALQWPDPLQVFSSTPPPAVHSSAIASAIARSLPRPYPFLEQLWTVNSQWNLHDWPPWSSVCPPPEAALPRASGGHWAHFTCSQNRGPLEVNTHVFTFCDHLCHPSSCKISIVHSCSDSFFYRARKFLPQCT